jgi:hypothetical protein
MILKSMETDSEYDYENTELDFFCSVCGCTILAVGGDDCFIDDLFCEVCEQNINDYIAELPPPPPASPIYKLKTID